MKIELIFVKVCLQKLKKQKKIDDLKAVYEGDEIFLIEFFIYPVLIL